ncbi:MAG TPA: GNAT family N-acetyltransferase [Steroidobacteraceae bacterium]|jgi:GNAT superfamily N-acetyltransferase
MTSTSLPRPGVTIRELRSEDRSRWHELWDGYLEFYRCVLPEHVTEFTWQRLIDPSAPLYGFAAVNLANEIIGIVHYHFHLSTWALTSYCYLEDLFVAPDQRGAGAGRQLIRAVYRAADERGATRVYWNTENGNERAQALYAKLATLTPFVQYRR